jgi:hypothetical protein
MKKAAVKRLLILWLRYVNIRQVKATLSRFYLLQ